MPIKIEEASTPFYTIFTAEMNAILIYMQRNRGRNLRRERLFRDRLNPLEVYDEVEIKDLFRFRRCNIIAITDAVRPHLQHKNGRGRALTPIQQVCVALWYYATGSMQLSLAAWINVHQSTVSRNVWAVTMALIRAYPESFAMRGSSKIGFHTKFGLPNILGCIDCTHVKITAPPIDRHPEEYINRKQYYSINVQAISDSDCKVMDLDVSWPGSVHDSRIFKNSNVYNQCRTGELQGILLGDNGYAIAPFLLTPFLRPDTPAEVNYNWVHKRARCTIERTFGQVKRRFHCIGSILRCSLDRVPSVIVSCFILHNLAKDVGDPDFEGENEEDDDDFQDFIDRSDNYLRVKGEQKRQEMVVTLSQ